MVILNSVYRKIILSIVSLLVVIATLGTVTYAWLTLAQRNILENLELSADGTGLELSVDGVNFYKSLPANLLNEYKRNIVMSNVTTLDGHTFVDQYKRQVYAGLDYMSFQIYFRSTNPKNNLVYLSNNVTKESTYNNIKNGTAVVSKGVTWSSPDFSFLYDIDPDVYLDRLSPARQFHASEAIRFSYIEAKNPNNQSDNRLDSELNKRIIDLTENEKRGFGKAYGAFDYYRQIDPSLNLPTVFPETKYELSKFDNRNPNLALNDNSELLELMPTGEVDGNGNEYLIGLTRVNIWLEGWDADMFEPIKGDMLKIKFQFKSGFKQ